MKKSTKSKRIKTERMKTEPSSSSVAANQDIVVLLTTLTQKLISFEAKMDIVLSRLPQQPVVAPPQQPTTPSPVERRRESRPMYKVICADCRKDSEVPFKPSSNRPVYCKECFKVRRNSGTFKWRGDNRPKEGTPTPVSPPEQQKAIMPAKPAKKKKPTPKKKKNKRSK